MLKRCLILFVAVGMFFGVSRAESMSEIYEKYKSSIVRIYNGSGSHGTGFVINEEGYILTNAHVTALNYSTIDESNNIRQKLLTDSEADILVEGKNRYYIVMQNVGGKNYAYRAKLIAERRKLDLALLKVDNLKKCTPLILSEKRAKIGERVATIGFPGLTDDINDKWIKCMAYIGLDCPSNEEIKQVKFGFITEKINHDIENANTRSIYVKIAKKQCTNQELTKEEQKVASESGLSQLFNTIEQYVNMQVANYINVNGFKTTAKAENIKSFPEEFDDIAIPVCGNFGSIEKIITTENWGLDQDNHIRSIMSNTVSRPGNSGGPLFDENGIVVGIVTLGSTTYEANTVVASDVSEAIRFLKEYNELKEKKIPYKTSSDNDSVDIKQLPKEAALCKIALDTGNSFAEKDGVFISSTGNILVLFDNSITYNKAYAIYKIGNKVFSSEIRPVKSALNGKLTEFKCINVKEKKFPFLAKSEHPLGKADDVTIFKLFVNTQKLVQNFDYRSLQSKELDKSGLEVFSSKYIQSQITDSVKIGDIKGFIVGGEKSDGSIVLDKNGNLSGIIIGSDKNGKKYYCSCIGI